MSVMATVSRLRARHGKGVRTNAPNGWLFVGASATRSAPLTEAPRTETDAAKVSCRDVGLSGDVTSRLMEDVREGTLDYTLTKPEDAQFLVSIAQVRIWKLTDFVLGSIVLGYALFNRGLDVGFDETITFAVSRLFWRYGLRNYSGASA